MNLEKMREGQKPKPPVISTEPVTCTCGHTVQFELFADAQDRFREARRKKLTDRACPACRNQAEADRQAKAKAAKAPPPTYRCGHPNEAGERDAKGKACAACRQKHKADDRERNISPFTNRGLCLWEKACLAAWQSFLTDASAATPPDEVADLAILHADALVEKIRSRRSQRPESKDGANHENGNPAV